MNSRMQPSAPGDGSRRCPATTAAAAAAAVSLVAVFGWSAGYVLTSTLVSWDSIQLREKPALFVGLMATLVAALTGVAVLAALGSSRSIARRCGTRSSWLILMAITFLIGSGAAGLFLVSQLPPLHS